MFSRFFRVRVAAAMVAVWLSTMALAQDDPYAGHKKVLIIGDIHTGAVRAHDAISHALATLEHLGRESGAYVAFIHTDMQLVTKQDVFGTGDYAKGGSKQSQGRNLDYFDAVVFYTNGAPPMTDRQKRDLLAFVHDDGKGFVAVHTATASFYDWPEYGEMVGGYFDNHPWGVFDAPVRVERPDFPGWTQLPREFTLRDEMYQYRAPYSRDRVDVLASLDASQLDLSNPAVHRTDRDFPIAWVKNYGKGRVFSCTLGHTDAAWDDPRVQSIYLEGIKWVLHSSDAPAKPHPAPVDPLRIESGLVSGKMLPSGVRGYFGVPFAAPPVGELRWREPQPPPHWTGVLSADRFAPECIQKLRAHDINNYFGEEATSEDCLYLNIWAPGSGAGTGLPARLPTIVWIYGGGFNGGSASMPNYSGETLARKGVVSVAIAYRGGAFGFLAHPDSSAESTHHASGNFGLLDQIAALQWVQRNIAAFGGDPGNVTVMGQSAGSMSVSILQASPLAHGLFSRVVGSSGSTLADDPTYGLRPLAVAEGDGKRLQEALHAPSLAAMRELPADRILFAPVTGAHYGAIVDGYVLPAAPREIFAAGKQDDVPALIGFTHDESPGLGLQMHAWARAQAATGKSAVYAYLFSRVHPYTPGVTFSDHDPNTVGAYHSGDIPYWLGTLDAYNLIRTTRDWTAGDRELSDFMSSAIVAFATTGNPNRPGAHDWPVYQPGQERLLELNLQRRVISWPDAEH